MAVVYSGSDKKMSPLRRRAEEARLRKAEELRQKELESEAVPLEGEREDIVGISFALSEGDISAPLALEGCPRRDQLFTWLTADPWGELEEAADSAEKYWRSCMADMDTLKRRAADGEEIRIWADCPPTFACGALFVCDLLREADCPVSVVRLPKTNKRPDGAVVEFIGWGEVHPELLGRFALDSAPLTREDVIALSDKWRSLVAENAPLRAVRDGEVISVGEDWYDELIRLEYPEDECRVAMLIGAVLSKHRPGVGDYLLAQRIRALIASGELVMKEEDPQRFYNCVIARA